MAFEYLVQTYGSVVVAIATLFVTILYISLIRRMTKTEERMLEAQKMVLIEQKAMFEADNIPYLVFEHKSFNVGYTVDLRNENEPVVYKHRVDTYFHNTSKVRIKYYFEDFKLSSENGMTSEMSQSRQKRYRYILPDQERHHFCIMDDENFIKNAHQWHYFEYVLVYESCEMAHPVKYKSRRKIKYKPSAYGDADLIYLSWYVLNEYDGPYDEDTDNNEID
ncbi:MAG: hypothetical protein Q8O09_01950 [Bacillota bacterium]|nr:hypothetical protein [Bacillota bacterium]